jgi:hypothetical protein
MAFVDAKLEDGRRTAVTLNSRLHPARPRSTVAAEGSVTLRFAVPADAKRLARLAALDSSNALAQPSLLGEVDGQPLAALGLSDGTVIADPFHHTADLVDLLRARARHLDTNRPAKPSGGLCFWSRLQDLARRQRTMCTTPHRPQPRRSR